MNIPLKEGLKWVGVGGWHFSEKMDGVWKVKEDCDSILLGEQMKDGRFFAFDILQFSGKDLRRESFQTRYSHLQAFKACRNNSLLLPACGSGGEFLEAVLANGGEGVVAKPLDAPYGEPWHKCKRVETFDLLVTDKAAPSIRLGTMQGEDRGWCMAQSEFQNIRIGDVVEIAAYSLTAKGKLREPRFVRVRPDKKVLPV